MDFERLGIEPNDMVMIHAAVSKVGPLLNGPDVLIQALADTVGPGGTLLAYTDWDIGDCGVLDDNCDVHSDWREDVIPFDPLTSRSRRHYGILPEFLRTTPGAMRSGNPGASIAALGAKAVWMTQDHPLDYGYGENSPLARLVDAGGKVLNIGAPRGTMTLLHHAEHLARLPNKRVLRYEVPFAALKSTTWRMMEEYDTRDPVVAGLEDGYFADIVTQFLATGQGAIGKVGRADGLVVNAAEITKFAVDWLESRFGD